MSGYLTKKAYPPGINDDWGYDLSPQDLLDKSDDLFSECCELFDKVGAVPDFDVSCETVLEVLNEADCLMASKLFYLCNAHCFVPDADLENASVQASKMFHEYIYDIRLRKDIFDKLIILQQKGEPLKPEAKRYLDKLIVEGKRKGFHLDEITQKQVDDLETDILELENSFLENLDDLTTLEFSEQELDGLPSEFTEGLKKNTDSGKLEVTLEETHYSDIMKKCRVPETRKQVEFAYDTKCLDVNGVILEKLRQLRHQLAVLLGYPNFAAYSAELLMSKSAENVSKFLSELTENFAPIWEEEKKYALKLKEKECADLEIPFDGKLNSWDISYYNELAKETKYPVDKKELKEYFPLPVVKVGLLNIYQDLLGLKFAKIEGNVWHEDVELYSVSDSKNESLLGYVFLDLLPRPNKDSSYVKAVFDLQNTFLKADGTREVPMGVVIANLSKPKKDVPALLDHDDVRRFFHEFGHVMHRSCMEIEFAEFNLRSIENDFLEAPSLMLENWCWEKESLRRMSSHYLDKSEIPDDVLNNLVKSRFVNSSFEILHQILCAMYDQRIHSNPESDCKDLYNELSKKITGIEPQEGTHVPSRFEHLANGNEGNWYRYLWSEVYSMDMFETRFGEKNILNPDVGKDFRNKILKPGATEDAHDLMVSFLGREPSRNAFLLSRGMKI